MCRRVTCSTCGQPSWAGCGAHIESVLGDVAPDDRCQCDPADRRGSGLLARLLGRA